MTRPRPVPAWRRLGHAMVIAAAMISGAGASPAAEDAPAPEDDRAGFVARACDMIEREARGRALPPGFFARLIWKESRFNPGAVSPKGASGIAQFMPETARQRGLADPFDTPTALAASAAFLQDLKYQLGNLGLAAAGYNAGPNRVARWRAGTTYLPAETRDFVVTITGLTAEQWIVPDVAAPDFSLHETLPFAEACREFASRARPMARNSIIAGQVLKPWGVLIASNFTEAQTAAALERLRTAHALVAGHEPINIARRPNRARGGKLMYEVMLGVDDRGAGDALCARLHREGAACMVVRN